MKRGEGAEQAALDYLLAAGLTLVARNWRCRRGEIDLILREGATLVFVEVRQRSDTRFGGAGASITARKQSRILLAAQHFLMANALTDDDCRFDCILLSGTSSNDIEWLRDAFSLD